MKLCACGCGNKLWGQKKIYYNRVACRKRHNIQMLKQGCLPITSIEIKICPVCKREFLSWLEVPYKTCRMFLDSSCNWRGGHVKSFRMPKEKKLNHRITVCHQNDIECYYYSDCGGRKLRDNCYRPEIMTSGVQSISSECKVNLGG